MLAALLATSSGNLGHVQLPLSNKSMQPTTAVKHRRLIEDLLMKASVSVDQAVCLLFEKGENTSAADKRPLIQNCLAVQYSSFSSSAWSTSAPVSTGRLGPCTLVRVADMLGFDESTRPSPGARVEQQLVLELFE